MERKDLIWVTAIFTLVFSIRLYLAFGHGTFDYGSYFNLRQTQNIMETGLPKFQDDLSYGGRFFTFLPFFHYILAIAGKIMGIELAAKVVPELFASALCIVSYLIVKRLTRSSHAAIFSSFMSGFIPVYLTETVNSVSPLALVVPLMFLLLHSFLHMDPKNRKSIFLFIAGLLCLVLMHPVSILFILALYFYILLCRIEQIKLEASEVELTIFSTFLWLWVNLIIYKKALQLHGINIIWQNMPEYLYLQNFGGVDILGILLRAGLLPTIFGIYIIYRGIFGEKSKQAFLFISFAFSTAIMLWLKFISLAVGMIFLGAVLVILSSLFYAKFLAYLEKTRILQYKPYMVVGIVVVFVFTSVLPSVYGARMRSNYPTEVEIAGLRWLKDNTPPDSAVLAAPLEGHALAYYASRKNVLDDNFIFANDVNMRLNDINEIYKTRFKIRAIGLTTKYQINYILISQKTRTDLDFETLLYEDGDCIKKEYDKGGTAIYGIRCILN